MINNEYLYVCNCQEGKQTQCKCCDYVILREMLESYIRNDKDSSLLRYEAKLIGKYFLHLP
jgi:hypothetical protein